MAPGHYNCTSTILSEGFSSLDLIGPGSYGRVFRAYDEKMDSIIAIKKLEMSSPAQEENLKREIIAFKKIRHRNISPIFYALVRPKIAMLVMPVKEGNLHTLMPLTYDLNDKTSDFYGLTIQLLSALTYLQEEGISHRNIKPTNILIQPAQRGFGYYLTDFAITSPRQAENLPCPHLYGAPEMFTNSYYPVTTKQDVWSLFVTLAVACGQVSELNLRRKGLGDAVRAIMETGVHMPELEAMARPDPTQRASASVMFQCLRPKETISPNGHVEYPEVSSEYFGLYGTGRLETDMTVAIGPKADIRGLDGPLGLAPLKIIQEMPVSRESMPSPQLSDFDAYFYDLEDVTSEFEFRETSASPVSEYSQPPQGELLQSEQFQPVQRIEYQGQIQQIQPQPQPQQQSQSQQDQGTYICTASCCVVPRTLHHPQDRSQDRTALPPLNSLFPRPPSSSYSPSPYRYSPYAAAPGSTIQRAPRERIWQIWGSYNFKITLNANINANGQQGQAYVPPYPLACDYPTESSPYSEDLGDFPSS
ncbi:hypothetical protein ACHAQJ_009914 [Trichoderma viride]